MVWGGVASMLGRGGCKGSGVVQCGVLARPTTMSTKPSNAGYAYRRCWRHTAFRKALETTERYAVRGSEGGSRHLKWFTL